MFLNSVLLLIILLQGYTIYQLRSSSTDSRDIVPTVIEEPADVTTEGGNGAKGEDRGV